MDREDTMIVVFSKVRNCVSKEDLSFTGIKSVLRPPRSPATFIYTNFAFLLP